MKKKLENIVPDIYKAIAPLTKGNGLDISEEILNQLLDDIEDAVAEQAGHDRQIKSSDIGEEALKQLSTINTVAYVRFASVYRAFDDLDQFIQEIERLNLREKSEN